MAADCPSKSDRRALWIKERLWPLTEEKRKIGAQTVGQPWTVITQRKRLSAS